MRTSKAGIEAIKKFEGFSAVPYTCVGGYCTIGYGHVIKEGSTVPSPISRETAEELLVQDLSVAERAVGKYITIPLTQSQFDALVSFTFNLGSGALQRSQLRAKINRGEFGTVPQEFLKWKFAGGKVRKGLLYRRIYEANLFRAQEGVIKENG